MKNQNLEQRMQISQTYDRTNIPEICEKPPAHDSC